MDLVIVLTCIVLVLWYIWRKKHLSLFKNLGIPGPEPGILFGNLLELYDKGPVKCHKEWVKKYGRVVGYYYGMKPALLVTDAILLKNIFIRDFNSFVNREAFNPLYHYNPHHKYGQGILNLPGERWKFVRRVLTPTFTAAKMKQMAPSISSCIDTMINMMQEKAENGETVEILDTFQRVTMDVITRTAFGIRTDVQKNPKSKLLKASKLIFSALYKNYVILIGLSFPFLRRLCLKVQKAILTFKSRDGGPETMLRKNISKVLQHRRKNPQGAKCDLLQLMIDTKVYNDAKEIDTKELEIGNAESEANIDKKDDASRSHNKMEDNEIVSSAYVVLLAGYETTSTALAFTTYFIAKYPDVQEKLYEEICELINSGKSLEYSSVNELKYLDKVINESMRMYPPVNLFTNRYALKDVQYGNIKIPKGMLIHVPVNILHHDPEFWENPEVFDPERFNSKTNANGITYLPFGVGPRNCLGMRFAQMEIKFVLAHMIYNFKISLKNIQKDPLEIIQRVRIVSPKDGIEVKLQLRNAEAT